MFQIDLDVFLYIFFTEKQAKKRPIQNISIAPQWKEMVGEFVMWVFIMAGWK